MRGVPLVGSIAINAALLALLAALSAPPESQPAREPLAIDVVDVALIPDLEAPRGAPVGNGGGGAADHLATPAPYHVEARVPHHVESPWADVTIHSEGRDGDPVDAGGGVGGGGGNGIGTGIGAGIGAGVGIERGAMRDIAALRVPEPSKARPAKLLHPTRETEVDDAELYVAVVTVDTDGDVVGARMTRSHPGSRGDTAASMIWQFRYSPALDDAGHPVRSTFEQPFAVR